MYQKKYNKKFREGIITTIIFLVVVCILLAFIIVSRVQYNNLTKNMHTTEATITDINIDIQRKGYEQEIKISYTVNGKVYNRDLDTDTMISIAAGHNTDFEVGDVVEIYYNPDNPIQIATELTANHSVGILVFLSVVLLLFSAVLVIILINRKKFIMTEE